MRLFIDMEKKERTLSLHFRFVNPTVCNRISVNVQLVSIEISVRTHSFLF